MGAKTRKLLLVSWLAVATFSAYPDCTLAQQSMATIVGSARVIDGDTISIGNFSIRLEGVDAPEGTQTCIGAEGDTWHCGVTATQRLAGLIKGERVTCEKSGEDRYKRTLAFCRLDNGTELNAWLVREGLALAFIRYSSRYLKEEKEARDAKRGLWAGTFQTPWDWRATNQTQTTSNSVTAPQGLLNQQQPTKARGECLIKGNINRRGDKIYHIPGSKWYERTQINAQAGERWFCSPAEAEAAGWRPAR